MTDRLREDRGAKRTARLTADNAHARLGSITRTEGQIGRTFGGNHMRARACINIAINLVISADSNRIIITLLRNSNVELGLMIPGARGTEQITLGQAGGLVNGVFQRLQILLRRRHVLRRDGR